MPEPLLPSAATLATSAAVAPALTIFGVKFGLNPDLLQAGFWGSVAAMGLLNTVPSTGDTLRELLRTSVRRVGVAIGSSVTAAYLTPLAPIALQITVSERAMSSLAFLLGVGAQYYLPLFVKRFTPPGTPPAPPSQGDNP